MFSYRHGFHAGNHADILKHITIMCIARHLSQKEKPFFYIDTHSGAGIYDIRSAWAEQTGEAREGIIPVLQYAAQINSVPVPTEVAQYINVCSTLYKNGTQYPGSPEIVRSCLRQSDSMLLSELHPSEIDALRSYARYDRRVHVQFRDGFEVLKGMIPPRAPLPARGFVLTDPSYEDSGDYDVTADAVCSAAQKWPAGTFAVWYPLIARTSELSAGDSQTLKERLCSLNSTVLCAELCVRPAEQITADGHVKSLYGSGMIVIKPTWQLDTQLTAALEWVCRALQDTGTFDHPEFRVTQYNV